MPRTGYFGHDINYVLDQAQRVGLETVRTGEVMGYPGVNIELCIFRKPVPGEVKKVKPAQPAVVAATVADDEDDDAPIVSPFGIAPRHDDTPESGGQ
jgi:hypothetical protein